mmetsp:Transcript_19648/g.35481  ORF Transcript_19648/g.35481 Transcript_19648/m.35481 type:complete len:410 (+) Transcript_19648:276-1505(+)
MGKEDNLNVRSFALGGYTREAAPVVLDKPGTSGHLGADSTMVLKVLRGKQIVIEWSKILDPITMQGERTKVVLDIERIVSSSLSGTALTLEMDGPPSTFSGMQPWDFEKCQRGRCQWLERSSGPAELQYAAETSRTMHVELSNTENKIRRKLALILQPSASRLGHGLGHGHGINMGMYNNGHGHGPGYGHGHGHRPHDGGHPYLHSGMYHNGPSRGMHDGLAPNGSGHQYEVLGKRAFDSLSSDDDEMASQGRREFNSRSSSVDSAMDYASSHSARSERETHSEDEFADHHHHAYNHRYQASNYSRQDMRESPQPLLPLDHSYPFSYRAERGFCGSSELDEGDLERARMLLLFMHRPVSDDQRSQMREMVAEEHRASKMKLEDTEKARVEEHGSPVSITDMPVLTPVTA